MKFTSSGIVFSLRERQVDPLFVNGPRFEFLDRIPEEMRRKDLPDRRDLEVGAGLRLCPIQSREADLTASRVAHNHENDTSKNQMIRKSSHVFVEMGRQVPPEDIFYYFGQAERHETPESSIL